MKTTTNNYCLKNMSDYPLCRPSTTLRMTQKTTLSVAERMCDAIVYEYYPSPALGQVSIPYYLPESTEGWLVIADATGHDIAVFELQTGRNELHIDVSNYAAGTYFYGIRTTAGNCLFHPMVITK